MTATSSLVNQTIGNYRVVRLLGEGGMGVVYLAEHPVIGRKVAIKLLHAALPRDPDIVSRFFNEARAIHMIAHENIVEILDFGQTTDGQPYFIMEHLEGESLSEAVSRGPMPIDQVEAIGVQMCRALGAAHAKGIVHRDLKPHNVQLCIKTDDSGVDGSLQVKILDFGVAKILATPDGAQSVKTRTGSLMGTPLYMSPEQCKGAGILDHRTDIYSLGVMLFEMIAGRPPFTAEGVGELFAKHMLEEPPSLLTLAPATPPHMAAAIMKALAKEPADRFQSMDEFRKALIGEVKLPALPAQSGARRSELGCARELTAGGDHAVVGELGAGRLRHDAGPNAQAGDCRRRRRGSNPVGRVADAEEAPRSATARRRRQPRARAGDAARCRAAPRRRPPSRRPNPTPRSSRSASKRIRRAPTSSTTRTARTWAPFPWRCSCPRAASQPSTSCGWPATARFP